MVYLGMSSVSCICHEFTEELNCKIKIKISLIISFVSFAVEGASNIFLALHGGNF